MKLTYIKLIACALVTISVSSCKKLDDLQKNPNLSDQGSPKLILTGIEVDTYEGPWSFASRMSQSHVLNFNYYGDQSYSAASWGTGSFLYGTLRNVDRLDIEADKQGKNTVTRAYHSIAKFMRAYLYSKMTEQMGDIPLSDAMKGTQGVYYPKYDTQKAVYQQCLTWLEEVNTELMAIITENPNTTVEGDVFYSGNVSKWRKAVNSLKLRLLISLSKKDSDPDLKIKDQFNAIVSNPTKYPLISSNSDNLQVVYNTTDKSNNYPIFPDDSKYYMTRDILGATWVNLLSSLNDPRILIIASPAPGIADDPLNPFARYKGAKTGDIQSVIQDQTNQGKYCFLKRDYWLSSAVGIPAIQLGASETLFNIAEGINRGWATGDASIAYAAGISESMKFYGVSASDIATFLAQPAVLYQGNTAAGLNQILSQKYVAFFQNSGWQAFYNYRRTGVPTFDIGPSNENGGKIPMRFPYPQSEYTNNGTNVTTAVQSQFGGSDTRNDVMWLLK